MYMSHLLQKTLLTRCLSLSSPKNLALDFTDFVIALQHRDFANQEITQHNRLFYSSDKYANSSPIGLFFVLNNGNKN